MCNGIGRKMVTCPCCIANNYCDVGNPQEINYVIMFNKFVQRNIVLHPYIVELEINEKLNKKIIK